MRLKNVEVFLLSLFNWTTIKYFYYIRLVSRWKGGYYAATVMKMRDNTKTNAIEWFLRKISTTTTFYSIL